LCSPRGGSIFYFYFPKISVEMRRENPVFKFRPEFFTLG
jgi:hypothetical protein